MKSFIKRLASKMCFVLVAVLMFGGSHSAMAVNYKFWAGTTTSGSCNNASGSWAVANIWRLRTSDSAAACNNRDTWTTAGQAAHARFGFYTGTPGTVDLAGMTPVFQSLSVNSNLAGLMTISGSGTISVGSAAGAVTFAISNGSAFKIDAVIADGSGTDFDKQGDGTLTLGGVNTYSKPITVGAGSLMGVVGGSCAGSAVSVTNTAATFGVSNADNTKQWSCKSLTYTAAGGLTFAFDLAIAPSTTTAPLQVDGDLAFTATPTVTITHTLISSSDTASYPLISYTGSASGTAPTTVTLTPALTGGATAALRLDTTGKVLYLDVTGTGSVYELNWGTTDATWNIGNSGNTVWKNSTTHASTYYQEISTPGDKVIFEDTDSGGGNHVITLNTTVTPTSVTMNSANAYTLTGSGGIAGSIGLTKLGAGTLTLAVNNTYIGTTTITTGTLVIGDGGTAGSVAGAILDNAALTFNRSDAPTYFGVISGTGSLTVTGTGTLTLSGANTFAGGATLNGGTLILGADGVSSPVSSAIGTNTFTISGVSTIDVASTLSSVTLRPNMAHNWNADFTFVGTKPMNIGNGAVTLGGNRQVTVNANFLTVNGSIGDGGAGYSLTKAGDGMLVLANANTYSGGTTLNAGQLNINHPLALGLGGGTFTINGGTLANTSATAFTTLNYHLVWGGDFAFSSNTNLNLGAGAVTLGGNRQVTVNDHQLTVGGIIGDGGSGYGLTKAGAGTLTLTGVNTYTGNTTISSGILALSGSGSINGSPNIIVGTEPASAAILDVSAAGIIIGSGQTLKGYGTIRGNITVNGTLAPGTSVGTLTLTNNLAFGAAAHPVFELSSATSSGNDKVILTGSSATLDGAGSTIIITPLTTLATADYILFDLTGSSGSVIGNFATAPGWGTFPPANASEYSIITSGKQVLLHWASCTTPTAYSVTGGGAYCSGGSGVAVGLTNSESGVTYQLYRNGGVTPVGIPVAADPGNPVSFGNLTIADTYTVVATRTSGGCTNNMTGSAIVVVNAATAISDQPTNQAVCANSPAIFTVGATGTSLTYQWQVSGDAGVTFTNISATATNASYTNLFAPPADNGNQYQVIVTGTCGSVTSAPPAVLTISVPVLNIVQQGAEMVISWPVTCSNYVLEENADINSVTWTATAGSIIVVGDQNTMTVPAGSTNLFFRLRYP